MEKKSTVGLIVLAMMVVTLLTVPSWAHAAHGSAVVAPGHPSGASFSGVAPAHVTAAAPHPQTTFPRTVLVETFTAQWCIYCEMESQAWYAIQHSTTTNSLIVGELHVCYSQSQCGDGYITADGTSTTRSAWYGVSAFPDVFFDGNHQVLGALNTLPALQNDYQSYVNNASAVPANVSIAQTASVTTSTVTSHALITSGVTGTYHAITYLVEFIGKNDSTGHDIDYVVRESLADHTVSLTAGATTELIGSRAIGISWNVQHMSVITLVQQNSTKIVENANLAPVTTLNTAVALNQSTASAGSDSTITVQVLNSSTTAPVIGASVTLTSNNGGILNPATGVTGADGSFTSTYTAPSVSSSETMVISAQVTAAGYTSGSASASLVVNPLVLPSAASGLTIAPGNQQVPLTWAAPTSGTGGVSYYVYRSTSVTGTYSPIAITTFPTYVDSDLTGGQAYWYKIGVRNGVGFSPDNTSAVAAVGLTVMTQGLSAYTGWWITIATVNFASATNASLPLYLPQGSFDYELGVNSYGFTAPESTGTIIVAGLPVTFTAAFLPRYASLEGTVNPVTAIVTVDGNPISVVDGSFSELMSEGTYTIVTTASGYTTNTTTVTLTPGNTTSVAVALAQVPSASGSGTSDAWMGAGGMASIALIAIVGIAAVLGLVVLFSRMGKRGAPPRHP